MTKDEILWGNVRFFLLLALAVAIIFLILCRFILNVPSEDSTDLISDINRSEEIFRMQDAHALKSQKIWNDVDSLDFNIHQVQRMDEIKDEISGLQNIFRENNRNTKFQFGVLTSRTLKFRFDIQEELSSLRHNNALIEQDLEECKANL